MQIAIVVIAGVCVLLLSRLLNRAFFDGRPERLEAFRRTLYRWSYRAAGIALVLAILFVIWLKVFAHR